MRRKAKYLRIDDSPGESFPGYDQISTDTVEEGKGQEDDSQDDYEPEFHRNLAYHDFMDFPRSPRPSKEKARVTSTMEKTPKHTKSTSVRSKILHTDNC
jgi:hypothetical protein